MYIDLSSEGNFEKEYERLLRYLYKRPEYRKPALGQLPSWLIEDAPPHFKTDNVNKQIRDAITRNPSRLSSLSTDFEENFFESLDQFQNEALDTFVTSPI